MEDIRYKWPDDAVVKDHTKKVKKLWDGIMTEYPWVNYFDTQAVSEVTWVQKMGPYEMVHHKILYKIKVLIDKKPLFDVGYKIGEQITKELWQKAYGSDYFDNMRHRMRELLKFAGFGRVSNFDFDGDIDAQLDSK